MFSRNAELKGVLFGWNLATFPNNFIVYHNSEVHFAPTHSPGISIFDPATRSDKKIYPPMPYSEVRSAFIARVAARNGSGSTITPWTPSPSTVL